MNPEDFQDSVINTLAVITTKVGAIEDHLRTLNGKVVKQEEANFQRQMELKDHEAAGKVMLDERLKPIEAAMIASASESAANRTWFAELKPLIWVVAGAVGIVLVKQASLWLPVLGK